MRHDPEDRDGPYGIYERALQQADLRREERNEMTLRPNEVDCYDYVRRYYNVPAYIGVRVKVGGKEGVIVKASGSQQYVHIRLDGQKHANPYHPTDGIEYRTAGQKAAQP